jgi:hypothetical protein
MGMLGDLSGYLKRSYGLGESVFLPPPVENKTLNISCPSGTISILKALYGTNCHPAGREPEATRQLKAACDGKNSCSYYIHHTRIGDPCFGTPKTFHAEYTCGGLTFDQQLQLKKLRHEHEMAMMKLRLELQKKGLPPAAVQQATQKSAATASAAVASGDVAALKAELDALKRAQDVAKQGGAVTGTTQSVKELLAPGQRQVSFMRSSKKPGQQAHWKSWERLKQLIPADFDEAKYLLNNPDVAAAVKSGAMPSGAYHYAMYGMGAGCQAGKDPSGKGHCDTSPRSFKGWRRPGYLAGIFANWDQIS